MRWGSSPHVRGAPGGDGLECRGIGIIPACAGSTIKVVERRSRRGDHPRMCGEHFRRVIVASTLQGSSPHVRGAPT